MSSATAILDTIVARLAVLFLAGTNGNHDAAKAAAQQMLVAYNPETENELRLAAQIVSFSLHALEALSQAAAPDISLTRILRLRSGAVSLSREAAKAERQLRDLQKARQEAAQQPKPQPLPESESVQTPVKAEKAVELVHDTRKVAAYAKANGLTWTQAYKQRQRDMRLAANAKKAEATALSQAATATRT